MFDMSKLRGKIVEKFGSQWKFAAFIGKSPAFVSSVMNGKSYLEQRDIDLWASALGIQGSELNDYFFTHKVHETEQA